MQCIRCGASGDYIYQHVEIGEFSCDDCGFCWQNDEIQNILEFHVLQNGETAKLGIDIGSVSKNRSRTISKAVSKFEFLASTLKLSKVIVDKAAEIFKIALNFGLTLGCPANLMAGTCIYLASRIKKEGLMLSEVSNVLEVSAERLGRKYKMLKHKLSINVDDFDPVESIGRYAQKLELGNQIGPVCRLAQSIVICLKENKLSCGCKPSGIIGVALLISCKVHRFDRNFEDITRITGSNEARVKQHLKELMRSSMGDLTPDQFMKEQNLSTPTISEETTGISNIATQKKERKDDKEAELESLPSTISVMGKADKDYENLSDFDDEEINNELVTPEEEEHLLKLINTKRSLLKYFDKLKKTKSKKVREKKLGIKRSSPDENLEDQSVSSSCLSSDSASSNRPSFKKQPKTYLRKP